MWQRGVTRPMAGQHGDQHESGESEHGPPYSDQRHEMVRAHHGQTLWIYWTLILLGVWTICAPFHFGYLNESLWVDPSGGRGVWFSESTHTALRAWLMTWSDVASGLLLVVLGWRSLTCMGEVLRPGRFGNVLLGIVLAGAPWFLSGSDLVGQAFGLAAGLIVALLALPRGAVHERYGGWLGEDDTHDPQGEASPLTPARAGREA